MSNFSFKTFTWPINPEVYNEYYERDAIYAKADTGDTVFSGMGEMKRVITGSGAFFGTDAFENFKKLATLFEDAAAGTLTHPVWGARTVFFTELQMTQPPKADYVAYSFTFKEADSTGALPK